MIEEISTAAELCALAGQWRGLCERVPDATPFQSPEWLLPWWKHLFRGGEMWTIAVHRNGLAGLAPMFIYGEYGERAAFIGTGVSDYSSFLAEDTAAAEEIFGAIASSARWERCDLQEIPPESVMLRAATPGLLVQRSNSAVCPTVCLPSTLAELESRLSPKFRHTVRNSRNRLLATGVHFESAEPRADEEYLDALIRLHTARWNEKGEPGVLSAPDLRSFMHEVCGGFRARQWLRFHGLRFRGELKAVVCIFCAHRRNYFYLGGFDAELSRFSPGSALIHYAIEQAIEECCTDFDFLRQGEAYKYSWGAANRFNTRLVIHHQESSATNR